ncbi:Carboxylic ester hydrolase [Aphelenchoides fujianensis]|nr:Carboxylic ester hydrolase [Aphelenchoides fujianensis]
MTDVRICESPIVRTEDGRIRGRTFRFDGHSAASFLGIPFAKPPVAELRFQKPQPVERWGRQLRECTQFGGSCPLIDTPGSEHLIQIPQSEANCLCLNVFAPVDHKNKFKSKLPVLFYVHGGGFVIGNSAHAGDLTILRFLCAEDVVVVTTNYRLGLFGFLSTGDEHAVGNYGLWDQTAALRWVKRNIEQFGGDRENVTVAGHSAGGVSADLLALSPHSRDLFHKVAPLAGASFSTWATSTPRQIRSKALAFAKMRGFPPAAQWSAAETNRRLVAFLRSLPADLLAVRFIGMPLPGFDRDALGMHVSPVIDGDFFPRPLEQLRREAPKKPVLTGVTRFEGLIFSVLGEQLEAAARQFVRAQNGRRLTEAEITPILERFVPPHGSPSERVKAMLHLISDAFISYGLWQTASEYARNGNDVFLYTFDYVRKGGAGPMGRLYPFEASCHGTEMPYLFGCTPLLDFKLTPKDERLRRRFTAISRFSTSSNPNGRSASPKWAPLFADRPLRHLVVRLEEDELRDDFCDGRPLEFQQAFPSAQSKL